MTFVSEFGPIDVGTPVSHKRTAIAITKYIVKTKNQPEMKRDTLVHTEYADWTKIPCTANIRITPFIILNDI